MPINNKSVVHKVALFIARSLLLVIRFLVMLVVVFSPIVCAWVTMIVVINFTWPSLGMLIFFLAMTGFMGVATWLYFR